MNASVAVKIRERSSLALSVALASSICTTVASAADCPGRPDALGTSRTLVVDPKAHPKIGTMQYRETLPLNDHEVVLTFDDGPIPKHSYQVLQTLASQCVKATFFMVGSQAKANPAGVRKVRDAGHTVATHTQNHPSNMHRLGIERAKQEIDDGIASMTAALADGSAPAPFFRIPGLARNEAIEAYAYSRGLQVWSADFPADDWRPVSPARVYDLAIQRLEAQRKGVLLLHDIQPRTVAALPRILNELKARGYRIVHVVPATPDRPATPTEPSQWLRHPATEMVAVTRWPRVPNFVFTQSAMLPAPGLANLDWRDPAPPRGSDSTAVQETPWPEFRLSQAIALSSLPAPAASVFRIPEAVRLTKLAGSARASRPQQASSRPRQAASVVPAKPHATAIPPVHPGKPPAARPRHPATQGLYGAPKHTAQTRPGPKRLAPRETETLL